MRFSDKNVWQKIKLNEYADFLQGLTYSPNNVSTTGRLVLRSSNIQNSKLAFDDNVYVNMNIPAKISTKENDVLMCVRNGSKNLVGKTALITKEFENLAWGAFMNIIRPKDGKTLLFHFLNSQYFKNQIKADLNTATVNQITIGTLNQCKISIPLSEIEKDKLCIFFNLLDQRIDTQSKIIEKYESLIKAISNKLFFNITNRVNLSEICSITTGKLDANQMDENGIYPFFTCGKETLKINKYAFDCEAILISGNGDIGRTKYYNGKFNAYQRTYILYNFKGSPIFIKYAIDYALPKKVKEETQISAMPYIKLGTLSELNIPYPDIHIQIEDVQILNTLQTKINVEKEILEKLKEQKKYLLSNMFI